MTLKRVNHILWEYIYEFFKGWTFFERKFWLGILNLILFFVKNVNNVCKAAVLDNVSKVKRYRFTFLSLVKHQFDCSKEKTKDTVTTHSQQISRFHLSTIELWSNHPKFTSYTSSVSVWMTRLLQKCSSSACAKTESSKVKGVSQS